MVTLAEAKGDFELVRHMPFADGAKMLWETDRWDGPLRGVLCWRGGPTDGPANLGDFFFDCLDMGAKVATDVENEPLEVRIFAVVEMTRELRELEHKEHQRFVELVGGHTDTPDSPYFQRGLGVRDQKTHEAFYSQRVERDHSAGRVVALWGYLRRGVDQLIEIAKVGT